MTSDKNTFSCNSKVLTFSQMFILSFMQNLCACMFLLCVYVYFTYSITTLKNISTKSKVKKISKIILFIMG